VVAFWVGIAVAFIATAAGVIFEPQLGRLRENIFFHRGDLSGKWRQICPPSTQKNYERIDELEVHHRRSGRLVAFGKRVQPPDEIRAWKFEGHVSGNVLVAVFTPQQRPEDPGSFGVLLLHQDANSRTARWIGGYVRPMSAKSTWQGGRQVLSHPLIWERIH
jgi:hypothetical protein